MNESSWNNAANWHYWGNVYYSKSDTRLIVPKKVKWMGWTLNFAHPWANATLIGVVGVPLATTAGVLYLQTKRKV